MTSAAIQLRPFRTGDLNAPYAISLATGRGAVGVHVGVNRFNPRALRFWRREGVDDLNPTGRAGGRTVWMGRP